MNREKVIYRNHERVKTYLVSHGLDGVVLAHRANFAWFTCGGLNYVNTASERGVAALYIDTDKCVCITNNIEASRMKKEELKGAGIDVLEVGWHDTAKMEQL